MNHMNAFPICCAPSCFGPVVQESGVAGRWVVLVVGFGAPDEVKCIASNDVEDPTEIPKLSWTCEFNLLEASCSRFSLVRTPSNTMQVVRCASDSILFHRVVFSNVLNYLSVTQKHDAKGQNVRRPTPCFFV